MKLSVIMPVYNEAPTAAQAAGSVLSLSAPFEIELIAVDDGSTDGTEAILGDLAGRGSMRLIRHERNLGKGASVRDGFRAASGDAVMIFDADLEYDACDIPAVAIPVIEGRTPACFGSRFLETPPMLNRYGAFNILMSFLSSAAAGQRITDPETCMKCFSRQLADRMDILSSGFGVEAELLVLAAGGRGILEVPVSYRPRTRAEGKKIRGRDAIATLWRLVSALARKRVGP